MGLSAILTSIGISFAFLDCVFGYKIDRELMDCSIDDDFFRIYVLS